MVIGLPRKLSTAGEKMDDSVLVYIHARNRAASVGDMFTELAILKTKDCYSIMMDSKTGLNTQLGKLFL